MDSRKTKMAGDGEIKDKERVIYEAKIDNTGNKIGLVFEDSRWNRHDGGTQRCEPHVAMALCHVVSLP